MRLHLEKAKNNEKFLKAIEKNINEDFPDWKITVIFYIALHLIKALLKFKRKPTGYTHKELDNIINSAVHGAQYPFPQDKYECYSELVYDSRIARYSAIYSSELQFKLLQVNSDKSKKHLRSIKEYVISQGLRID